MNPGAIKFRLSDYFWPFGVSLLTGLISLYVATLGLFALGVSITRCHMLAFLLPAGGAAWLALAGVATARIKSVARLLLVQVSIMGLLTAVAAQFDDLSWDGMGARIEPIIAISSGWNPVKDREGVSLTELAQTHSYLQGSVNAALGQQHTLGCVLSSNLCFWSGSLNAGKAITPLLALGAFGIVFGALISLSLPFGWALTLALLASLNPVAIYQSSSYYIDGHTACLFTAMIFSALRLLVAPLDTIGVLAMVVSFLGLSAAKTSGVLYGGIIDMIFMVFYAATHLKKLKPILIFLAVSALITWPAGILFRKFGGFPSLSLAYLQVAAGNGPGYGVGGGASEVQALLKLDKLQTFLVSYFAPSDSIPKRLETKFPFYFNRRELALFEDLSPDPRAGGFGPLYGGCLLLAVASAGMILLGRAPPMAALFPMVPILLSVGATQTWWARWAPQGWLIPVAFLLPVLCSLRHVPPGPRWFLPLVTLFAGLLNSVLVLVFYSVGCVKVQRVLFSQFTFLKSLSQPLSVHIPIFHSNRTWFRREGLDFRLTEQVPPAPRLKLVRTNTRVELPANWEGKVENADILREWEKRGLLEK